jgi:outer membrane protein OmpA-like peptidoglycan-associated protein
MKKNISKNKSFGKEYKRMKKNLMFVLFVLLVSSEINYGQLAKDSWAVGFGFRYPRFISVNISPSNTNYGGYISLQRTFTEHVALRLKGGFSHFQGTSTSVTLTEIKTETNLITGDLDLLYYLVPCESVSPYLYGGLGGTYHMLTDKVTTSLDKNAFAAEFNFGGGLEWSLDPEWKLVTEIGYHITSNSELDGAIGTSEVNGKDTYIGINLGIQYYFDKGEPSKYCQLYSGISGEKPEKVDYDRIEEMIKAHIPKEVVKEVAVQTPAAPVSEEKWVLVGVNFDSNKSNLKPESYPILYDAAKTLLKNPDMKVEIQGYTDNIGSESYNKKLSEKRAEKVREYLVAKGVNANRLTTVGYGESNPVADNKTADGRAMNRRIEFKVQ